MPIPKDVKKNMNDSKNYRAIALMCAMVKLLDWIILTKFGDKLLSSNLQHGFSDSTSTGTCTFMFKETVCHYIENNSNVYTAFLDASKAFDRVNTVILFNKLVNRMLPFPVIRLLYTLYRNQTMCVKWGNCFSDSFGISNGVRQGAIASPVLFCVYIDDLLKRLEKSHLGCHIGHIYCGALGYADDIVLLSPQASTLQKMLNICCEFAYENDIIFKKDKSNFVIFSKNKPTMNPGLFLYTYENGIVMKSRLQREDNPIHLGHTLQYNLVDESDIMKTVNKFIRKANSVISDFKMLYSDHRLQMIMTYCTSFYGCQLWCKSLGCLRNLYCAYRNVIRKTLRIPSRTHNNLIPLLTGKLPLQEQINKRVLSFMYKCFHSHNIYVKSVSKMSVQSPVSYYGSYVRELLYKYNLFYYVLCCENQLSHIKSAVYKCQGIPHDTDVIANAGMINELIDMRDGLTISVLSKDEIVFLLEYLCTA